MPSPPVLVRLMPARPASSCWSEDAWLRSISARPITWAGDRLSRNAIWVRVAVTSTSSRSVAGSAARAVPGASRGRASARATAVVSGRNVIVQLHACVAPHPAPVWGVATGGCTGADRRQAASARRDALRIATWVLQGRSPGLRSGIRHGLPDSSGDAFPCRAQWRMSRVAVAYRCGGSAGLVEGSHPKTHRLPVSTLPASAQRVTLQAVDCMRSDEACAARTRRRPSAVQGCPPAPLPVEATGFPMHSGPWRRRSCRSPSSWATGRRWMRSVAGADGMGSPMKMGSYRSPLR